MSHITYILLFPEITNCVRPARALKTCNNYFSFWCNLIFPELRVVRNISVGLFVPLKLWNFGLFEILARKTKFQINRLKTVNVVQNVSSGHYGTYTTFWEWHLSPLPWWGCCSRPNIVVYLGCALALIDEWSDHFSRHPQRSADTYRPTICRPCTTPHWAKVHLKKRERRIESIVNGSWRHTLTRSIGCVRTMYLYAKSVTNHDSLFSRPPRSKHALRIMPLGNS